MSGKRKEVNYEFVVDVPPDEDCIRRFHKVIADSLIKKYGIATMKEVVKQMEAKDAKA